MYNVRLEKLQNPQTQGKRQSESSIDSAQWENQWNTEGGRGGGEGDIIPTAAWLFDP